MLNELDLFPETVENSLSYLFLNFGENEFLKCFELSNTLRARGISCEVYPAPTKIQKQMKYANERNAKTVLMIGEDELSKGEITLKSMGTGEQETMTITDFLSQL